MARQLPSAVEEEKAVLGCCLLEWESALPKTMSRLNPRDFHKPAHRKIFEAMALLLQKQTAIDYLTLSDQLEAMGCLNEVGGAYYLTELSQFVPSAARVGYYADIVKEKSNQRTLIIIGKEMAEAAFENQSPTEISNQAIAKLFNIDTATAKESFKRIDEVLMYTISEKEKGRFDGIPTGIEPLDKLVKIQPTDLVIIAGRPSMGKSAFCMEMSRGMASNDVANAIFSLEMAGTQWGMRILTELGQDVGKRIQEIIKLPLWIDDAPSQKIETVIGKMYEMKNERNVGAFFIDYLQKIRSSKKETRNLEIGDIVEQLKAAAKQMRVPVIALSQLSRKVEERTKKRPTLSDLRESGQIEQEADVIIFLYRHGFYFPKSGVDPKITEFHVKKQRQGEVGEFKMIFNMDKSRFNLYEEKDERDSLTSYKPFKDDDEEEPGF